MRYDLDGIRGGMQYLANEFFFIDAPAHFALVWTGSIRPNQWQELVEKCQAGGLRQIGREYGGSYETVRRTLKAVK